MENRKDKLLQLIIENYLETADPVGSKFLIESADLELSGATVRNEMRELEEEGFLSHPHTSAGRIPTEKGYGYYIGKIMKVDKPDNKIKNELGKIAKEDEDVLKKIAKQVAEYLDNSVIFASDLNSIYYTGISNLFSQPEFRDYAHTVSVSAIFDECEDRMESLYEAIGSDVEILVGKNNPFGNTCGIVAIKMGETGLFAVLGPMRMDYSKTVGILKLIKEII